MQAKTLFAALVAAAFAFPVAAHAGGGDKHSGAKTASANGGANDGGAQAMFTAMDKNNDGFVSKEEAMGTPHYADFGSLDKNNDGKLSAEEHYNAKEHVAARAKNGSTSSSKEPGNPGSGKTY